LSLTSTEIALAGMAAATDDQVVVRRSHRAVGGLADVFGDGEFSLLRVPASTQSWHAAR
jgi:hypothetical protein